MEDPLDKDIKVWSNEVPGVKNYNALRFL